MKHIALTFAIGLLAAAILCADTPVQMAPYGIGELGFRMQMLTERKTGKLGAVWFSEVDNWSAAWKAGLRKGDHLLAIDGTAVAGLDRPAFLALLRRSVPFGQVAQYSFTVRRGKETKIISFFLKAKRLKVSPDPGSSVPAPSEGGPLLNTPSGK